MAHIDYSRQLQIRFSDTLERVMPLDMGGCNFAAFGGTLEQRADSAVQTAARYCGRCGIVVLLNESDGDNTGYLEQQLRRMPAALPDSHAAYRRTLVRPLAWSSYDLLYGLDENAITALMFPGENLQSFAMQTNSTLAGLQAYLAIIRSQFEQNSAAFGAYPFNLNLLHQITKMPYGQLERTVLNYLPDDVYYPVQKALSKDSVQINVHSLVNRFAENFRRFHYLPGDFGKHSRRSIVQAVSQREITCVRIPSSSEILMNYVEAELNQLSDTGVPYLLISSELNLTKNEALQERFLSKPSGNIYMGILAESMSSVVRSDDQQNLVFGNYPQILVFQCAADELAEPFSKNCGTYKRTEVHQTSARHWAPFHILPMVGSGEEKVWRDERNIRTEELTKLGNGVLLCGKLYTTPVKINNLRRKGGILDGIHMQQLPSGR